MTKIDIFSGFLGAGKTTLIKKLLAEAYVGEQVVLIENEFGEIGIDGGFLQDAGINITEMNSGCICCSLVGDFTKALAEVYDRYHPDRIIIEPSGVGKLSDVIRAVSAAEMGDSVLNALVTVVDAGKCKMYMKNFGEFFNDQLIAATTVILSHTDTASDAKVEDATHRIREKNADATLITTPWSLLSGKDILAAMEKKHTLEDELRELAHHHEHHHHEHHHEHDEHCDCGCHEHEHEHHHEHDEHCDCGCHDHEHEHHHHEHDEHCDCGCHEHEHEHHHHEHDEHCDCGCHDHDHEHEHHHEHDEYCDCGCHDHEHEHHHDHEHDEHCDCGCHDHEHEHHHEHDEHCDCGCHDHDHEHHHHEHDEHCDCGCHGHHHHADEVFSSFGVETAKKYTKEQILEILEAFAEDDSYGMILRAKGIVAAVDGSFIHFDYTPGEPDVRTGCAIVTGRLCVIGSNLEKEKIADLFGVAH